MAHTWTWDKLDKNAKRLNPRTRGPNSPYTPKFERLLILPFVGTRSCLVKLQAWGVTQSSLHQVTLLFSDCDILTGEQDVSLWDYFKIEYQNQIYYVKKFDKYRNPLTSRCTCFTGDTKVLLADGTCKTFKELDGQSNFKIIAYNEKIDKFEIVNAINCEKKKENTEILRVTLDNGKYVDCTPDHLFLTKRGDWVQAKDLTINESLRALYLDKHKMQRILPDNKRESIKPHKVESNFYVYIYLDPRYPGNYQYNTCQFNFKPIYVGKGKNGRIIEHRNYLDNAPWDRFHNTVQKLLREGLEPITLKYAVNLEEDVAFRIERELISEIGREITGTGPLLNIQEGGIGGSSKFSASLTKHKNQENGCYERASLRMLTNNPMKNPEVVERMQETRNSLHSKEERSSWGYTACHTLSKEERSLLGNQAAEHNRAQVAQGTHHTQTEEWRKTCKENAKARWSGENSEELRAIVSKTSKSNWENPEIRNKMINSRKSTVAEHKKESEYVRKISEICKINGTKGAVKRVENFKNDPSKQIIATRKMYITRAAKIMAMVIKKLGRFDEYEYEQIAIRPKIKLKTVKSLGIYDEALTIAYEKAVGNHKVVSIECIDNQDVYCLTAEYLGNFVVDVSDDGSNNIFSGIVQHNCKDFFFTWAWYNYYNGHCLYGPAPKPYQRKTTWMPPRNPLHLPGSCKHIHNAWAYMKREGLTKN
jgi:hypothetical protein